MRPSAQTFLWKWVLFAWEWKIISISKAEHFTSFWYRGPGELGNGPLTFVVVFPGKTTRGDFTKPTWRIYERHKGSYERSVLWDVCFNQLSGKTYESSLKLCSHFSYTGLPFVSTRKADTHRTSYRGTLHQIMAENPSRAYVSHSLWRSIFEIGAPKLCSVAEVSPKITFWLALKTTHMKVSVCDFPVITPLSVNKWFIIPCNRMCDV